jgi:flagellar hook protein FlgE
VSGIRDATVRLDVAASNIANATTEGFTPSRVVSTALPGGGVDPRVVPGNLAGVDLVGELVGVMMAKAAFVANAKMLSTTSRTERRALDLLG